MDVIYIDELAALNFFTDYLLLLSAARLRGLALRRGRLALAALAGSLYAVACVLPGAAWLQSGGVKLAASLLMALIAWGGGAGWWRSWAAFLGVSAAFAGAVFACSLLSGQRWNGLLFLFVPLRTLLLSFGVLYALLRLLLDRVLLRRERAMAEITAVLGERRVSFTALRDTGNGLCDPVSGRSVLIADAAVLLPLLGTEGAALPPCADAPGFFRALDAYPALRRRFVLLPYRAVGTAGLLACFRADEVLVDGARSEVLLGLSPTGVGESGEYRAIL